MAKRLSVTLDRKYINRINNYVKQVDRMYQAAIRDAAAVGASISNYNQSKPFVWKDYPQAEAQIDKIINSFYTGVFSTLNEGTRAEWLAASKANDKIVDRFLRNTKLSSIRFGHYYDRNMAAFEAFQKRKIRGLDLSDRVWNTSKQFRNELEICMDIGLSEGKSAAQLSRDIRKYLNEPNRLYRRIRDEESGKFYLSQNAKKYNPGRGIYRSSYKNAMRLTRTEINMAYRQSDMERYYQLDFVVGYEVRRSNRVYDCDVCESLAGRYPKSFIFTGWHPNCLCHTIAILADRDEFIEQQRKILSGEDTELRSKNEVTELPDNFTSWYSDNKERIDGAKSKPYYFKDNVKLLKKLN